MDGNIRTLLQEKAEEMRIDDTIPEEVLRRSRRRRTATAGVAALVTIGVVAGAFVGARTLLQERRAERRDVRPAGSPPAFHPYIFPTREELSGTITKVEEGAFIPASPAGTAVQFAIEVLGWNEDDVEVSVRGDEPITAVITNPALNEAAESPTDLRTTVIIEQVPGSHDPPIFAVIAAQAEDIDLEPTGPDQKFGAEGRIALRGRVSFVPPGASVILSVDRRPAAPVVVEADGRFEVSADIPSPAGPTTLLSIAMLDGSGRTLALTSARAGTAAPEGGQWESSERPELVPPPRQIPPAVAATRQAILDAAQADDYRALRDLIPERGFTFSYGGERDPIAYWRYLESEAHVPVFGDVVPRVLGTEPGPVRGGFIWPAQAGEDPSQWDAADLEALSQIHLQQDIRRFQQIGLYTGWRIEIARDGTWLSFVQGD